MKKGMFLLCSASLMLTLTVGCSSAPNEEKGTASTITTENPETAESDSLADEEAELRSWLQEACDQYNQAELSGTVSTTTTTCEDGNNPPPSTDYSTLDSKNQIQMMKYERIDESSPTDSTDGAYWGSGSTTNYYTYENGKNYWYTQAMKYDEELGTSITSNVKICVDNSDYTKYQDFAQPLQIIPEIDEEVKEVSVKLINEDEQNLEICVDITYINNEEPLTREKQLEIEQISEEDLSLLDGMSEKLDAYIEERNSKIGTESTDTTHYWITKDSHTLIKSESIYEYPGPSDIEKDYFEASSKLLTIKSNLEEGYSMDEVLSFIEDMEGGFYGSSGNTKSQTVTTFVTGEDCYPIDPSLLNEYTEITLEQYQNGAF